MMEIDSIETGAKYITIKSCDGIEYNIDSKISNMSVYISNIIKENQNSILSLDNIKSSELNLIIQYCEHHKFTSPAEILKPLQFNELTKCVQDTWDADFISGLEFDKITDLLLAAEYLMINSITDLCYAKMALYFRVTPVQDLKKAFLLTDTEFSEHEIKEIKEGNNWLMALTEDRLKELDNC